MGKSKVTDLAAALKLVDDLNESDRATLRDYLKPARSKSSSPAQPAGRRSSSRKGAQTAGQQASTETGEGGVGLATGAASGD